MADFPGHRQPRAQPRVFLLCPWGDCHRCHPFALWFQPADACDCRDLCGDFGSGLGTKFSKRYDTPTPSKYSAWTGPGGPAA